MSADAGQLAVLSVAIETELRGLRTDMRLAVEEVKRAGKGIDGELEKVRKSTANVSGIFRQLRTAAALAAGFVGVGGIAQLARSALELADSLDAASNRLGFNVEELQRLRFAATQTGVEFGKLEIGLKEFQRRIGAIVSTGKGELAPVLQALGISLRDQNGEVRDSAVLFDEFLKKLGQVEDQTVKVAIAQKAFGESGVELLQIVAQGADEFERLKKSARVFTAEEVQKLDEAGDAIQRLQENVTVLAGKLIVAGEAAFKLFRNFGLGDDTRVELSKITGEIERLQAVQRETERSTSPFKGEALKSLAAQIEILKAQRTALLAESGQTKIGPELPRGFGAKATPKLSGLLVSEEDVSKQKALAREIEGLALADSKDRIAQARAESEELRRQIQEVVKDRTEAARLTKLVAQNEARDVKAAQEEIAEERKAFIGDIRRQLLRARGDRLGLLELETQDQLEQLKKQNLDFAEAQKAKSAILEAAALERLEIEKETAEKAKEEFRKQNEAAFEFVDFVSGEFGRLAADGELSFKALGESFRREFIQRAVSALVQSALLKVFGLGAGSTGASGVGGLIGGLFGKITGKAAAGADVKPGQSFLVGELGPEIFQAKSAGRIIPNGGGGGGVVVNITNTTGQPASQQQSRLPDGRALVSVVVGEARRQIQESIINGGPEAQAMEARFGVSRRSTAR